MKVYKGDTVMDADKEQLEIVLEAGWSKTKPETDKEVKAKEAPEVADKEAAEAPEVADAEKAKVIKPKKLRKVPKK